MIFELRREEASTAENARYGRANSRQIVLTHFFDALLPGDGFADAFASSCIRAGARGREPAGRAGDGCRGTPDLGEPLDGLLPVAAQVTLDLELESM
jgi:hypothetical protein